MKNWGFVPMTEREFDHLAREMNAAAAGLVLVVMTLSMNALAM